MNIEAPSPGARDRAPVAVRPADKSACGGGGGQAAGYRTAAGASRLCDRDHSAIPPRFDKQVWVGATDHRSGAGSMKDFDFSLFTDRQLENLARQVKLEYLKRREEARRLAKKQGGLVEGAGPQYRNPENPAETWSGRGARPAWVKAALAAGKTLEDLMFSDDRPVSKQRGSGPGDG
jgi:DNA-binding protein H-NS